MSLDEITMTEGSFVTHEESEWYPGVLSTIEEGDDYGFGPTIRFIIQLDGEEGETWAMSSQKLSPRSKLYGWVKGIDASLIPEVGQAFQYRKLEGRRVEVMFEAGEDREKVTKIRAEKKTAGLTNTGSTGSTVRGSTVRQKQTAAAKAKVPDYGPDEAPF